MNQSLSSARRSKQTLDLSFLLLATAGHCFNSQVNQRKVIATGRSLDALKQSRKIDRHLAKILGFFSEYKNGVFVEICEKKT